MEAIWKSLGDKPRAVQAETWKHWIVVVLCWQLVTLVRGPWIASWAMIYLLDDKISEPASSWQAGEPIRIIPIIKGKYGYYIHVLWQHQSANWRATTAKQHQTASWVRVIKSHGSEPCSEGVSLLLVLVSTGGLNARALRALQWAAGEGGEWVGKH